MEGKQIVNLQRNDDIISLFVGGEEGTFEKDEKTSDPAKNDHFVNLH